jgi:hypothetical protein
MAKDPHIAGWPTRATRELAAIREWFTGPYAQCWPSIFTGKFGDGSQALLVVDVDPRGMGAFDLVLRDTLPETRMHRTPRGGLHLFYAAPYPGVKSGTNVLADGIDIRSKGGLVHFGQGYEVVHFGGLAMSTVSQAPASLVAKCGGACASHRARGSRARSHRPGSRGSHAVHGVLSSCSGILTMPACNWQAQKAAGC